MAGFMRGLCIGIGLSWLFAPMKGQELRHLLLRRWTEIGSNAATEYEELTMCTHFPDLPESTVPLIKPLESPLAVPDSEVLLSESLEPPLAVPLSQLPLENKAQKRKTQRYSSSDTTQAPPHSHARRIKRRKASS